VTDAIVARANSGGNVAGNGYQPEHIDLKDLPRGVHGLQVLPTVVSQTKIKGLSSDRLANDVDVPIELVTNRGSNEVSAVAVKSILHHQIDVAEIDIAKVDGDLFAVATFGSSSRTLPIILTPSIYHLCGWYMVGYDRYSRPSH